MPRMYIFVIIAALILVISYNKQVRDFFAPAERAPKSASSLQESPERDDAYEKLGIELYGVASRLSDLQGKDKLLKMAKENRQWFKNEEYAMLDELIENTEEDLKKVEEEYQKTRAAYAKRTAQKMLEEFLKKQ
jgi:hypothetical protein